MKLSQSQADLIGGCLLPFVAGALVFGFISMCACTTPKRYIEPEPIGAYHNLTESDSMAIYLDIYDKMWGWSEGGDPGFYAPMPMQIIPDSARWEWIEFDDSVHLITSPNNTTPLFRAHDFRRGDGSGIQTLDCRTCSHCPMNECNITDYRCYRK